MLNYFKITVRFKDAPTLRLRILDNADASANIATVIATFESRTDITQIIVKKVTEQDEIIHNQRYNS